MNRDYIKDHVTIMIQKWTPLDIEEIIDMIYDDFESRIERKHQMSNSFRNANMILKQYEAYKG